MSKKLADQLGEDTVFRFVRSAPMRLAEGDVLSEKHPLAAIYFYGYAAEMTIKAAYFNNLGFSQLTEIDKDTRNRAMADARSRHLMESHPHDILGWARYLVWSKANLHTPAYEPKLGIQIITHATSVYDQWRPQMRYRNTVPSSEIVPVVRAAAAWFVANYLKLLRR